MSNITEIFFEVQPLDFPSKPITQAVNLKQTVLNTWINLTTGGKLDPSDKNSQTLKQLVAGAIQTQVLKSQGANATLDSLTFGPDNQIGYKALFVPPPASATLTSGAAGELFITLSVPGNNLAFTVHKKSNPTFQVSFELILDIKLTLPVGISSNWALGASVTAKVEVFKVTTHNVGVALCDKGAVNEVLKTINNQKISVPISPGSLGDFDGKVDLLGGSKWIGFLQSDNGRGTLLMTAVGYELTVHGKSHDSISINATNEGLVEVAAQGQKGVFKGPINSITVSPEDGKNSVHVIGAPIETTVTVQNTQKGANTVLVGGRGLSKLNKVTVNVEDTSGSTELIVDDAGDLTPRVASITKNAVAFPGLTTINYTGNVIALRVIGGGGDDKFFVSSTDAKTKTILDAGIGSNNAVYVGVPVANPAAAGSGDGSVLQLAGLIDVIDGGGQTSLVIDSSGDLGHSYQVYSDHVVFSQGPTIRFQPGFMSPKKLVGGVTALTIYGSKKGNNIEVDSVNANTKITLVGPQNDVISGPAAGSVTHDLYPPAKPGPVPHVPVAV